MEGFLIRYSIYVVFAVLLVVWLGIAAWLWSQERRIQRLESRQEHSRAIVNQ